MTSPTFYVLGSWYLILLYLSTKAAHGLMTKGQFDLRNLCSVQQLFWPNYLQSRCICSGQQHYSGRIVSEISRFPEQMRVSLCNCLSRLRVLCGSASGVPEQNPHETRVHLERTRTKRPVE